MDDVWITLGLVGVFFLSMAFRGIFGYLKNDKIAYEDLKFSWGTFFKGMIRPTLLTLTTGAFVALLIGFLKLVGLSGLEISGLDQISPQVLEIGLAIADIGAIGYAMKEALYCFTLTDTQIEKIRETVYKALDDESTGVDISYDGAELIAEAVNVKQDTGGAEELDETSHPELGAIPYYKVDVSTPTGFYNAVNGKGFNESWGCSCVAGFKEFCYSLCGKYVSTSTGAAKDYANQRAQIEPLGFTYYNDRNLQNGDWVILGLGVYGHVAMYYNGKLFGQNQQASDPNIGSPFSLNSISLSTYLCHYRPNIYKAPAPSVDVKVGDAVLPINWVDYNGKALKKTRDYYFVSQISGDRAVLSADSISGAIYAAVKASNLKKVNSTPAPTPKPIKAGDLVWASGKGYSTAKLTGARTKNFPRTKMKVILISGDSLGLNQAGKGTVGKASDVTGWWAKSSVERT